MNKLWLAGILLVASVGTYVALPNPPGEAVVRHAQTVAPIGVKHLKRESDGVAAQMSAAFRGGAEYAGEWLQPQVVEVKTKLQQLADNVCVYLGDAS